MKTTVITHSGDFDGIFCREIARKFLGDKDVEYIGWNFGDPKIPMPAEGEVYILDLSPDCLCDSPNLEGLIWNRIRWVDHHRTSISKWPAAIPGYRIDGVAACRLAWQWFSLIAATPNPEETGLPQKQDFIDRKVDEPLAVRLAGEYDVWDKRDRAADVLQYGLRCQKEINWVDLFNPERFSQGMNDGPTYLEKVLLDGMAAQSYAQNVDATICKSFTWIMGWEGLKWLCVNHARLNSQLFAARDIPETGHDALLGFRFDGKTWMVSLYHAKHRTDLDLSEIAVKHGGGGHRGACGFTCKTLPFSL